MMNNLICVAVLFFTPLYTQVIDTIPKSKNIDTLKSLQVKIEMADKRSRAIEEEIAKEKQEAYISLSLLKLRTACNNKTIKHP